VRTRSLLPLILVTVLAFGGRPATAQNTIEQATDTPEQTARLFLRSVRAIRWATAAQFVHPAALDRFHLVVTQMVRVDTTGDIRRFLTQTDSAGYTKLSSSEVFARAVGAVVDDMPGLMDAIYERDDTVLGHVSEGRDTAHVVYRSTPRLPGSTSEVKVMQLTRTPRGWRVRWSDELEVLWTAVEGALRVRHRSPPPGGGRIRARRLRHLPREEAAYTFRTVPPPCVMSATAALKISSLRSGTPHR